VNWAITVVFCIVLWLNIAVVNTVTHLKALQHILHLLLYGQKTLAQRYTEGRVKRTSSRARMWPASMTALV
jgi:hypothetical protein